MWSLVQKHSLSLSSCFSHTRTPCSTSTHTRQDCIWLYKSVYKTMCCISWDKVCFCFQNVIVLVLSCYNYSMQKTRKNTNTNTKLHNFVLLFCNTRVFYGLLHLYSFIVILLCYFVMPVCCLLVGHAHTHKHNTPTHTHALTSPLKISQYCKTRTTGAHTHSLTHSSHSPTQQ